MSLVERTCAREGGQGRCSLREEERRRGSERQGTAVEMIPIVRSFPQHKNTFAYLHLSVEINEINVLASSTLYMCTLQYVGILALITGSTS